MVISEPGQEKLLHPRTMPYPYTFGARIRQFPYKYHWVNQPLFRWLGYTAMLLTPAFFWFTLKLNSPGYVRGAWAKREKEMVKYRAEYGHKQKEADHKHFNWKPHSH